METVRLRVIGITYTQIENGMYALVLEEDGGSLRIPIIIGYTEAQAIESAMQKRELQRPLPHDTICTVLRAFDIQLESVLIRLNDNGIFTADLRLTGRGGETHVIDSRSSDAIAMALRLDAPILTSKELLEKSGMDKEQLDVKVRNRGRQYPTPPEGSGGNRFSGIMSRMDIQNDVNTMSSDPEEENPLKNMSESTLQRMMERAVNAENYEKAARIKDELDRRSNI